MARSFASASSQYLIDSTWTLAAEPLTLACWAYPLQTNAFGACIALANSGSVDGRYYLAFNSTAKVQVNKENNSGTGDGVLSSVSYTANQWTHACGVFSSDTSRSVYVNGADRQNNTTSIADPTINNLVVGGRLPSSGITSRFNGHIAHAAVWNAALTDAEVAALYSNGIGTDPRSIRPDALLAYWPLLDNDGDRDWWGDNHLTATNSPTYAQHPPVLMKSRPTVVVMAGSSAPIISSVTVSGTRQIGQTLTASVATSPTPVDSIAYQWQKAATDNADPGTDLTGETSQTLALSYEDFGDLLDSDANSVYVRCQAIATNGGQDSAEVASDWLSVSLPAGGGVAGSPLKSPFLIS